MPANSTPENGCKSLVLVGLGDPVMDVLVRVSNCFIDEMRLEVGGCLPVECEQMDKLLKKVHDDGKLARIPGGSGANVVKATAMLSGGQWDVALVGMTGKDNTGREYREKIEAQHVKPLFLEAEGDERTAKCLCMVTPDGQRTMRTCLGAATAFNSPKQLPQGWLSDATSLLHCEGYCLYRPDLALGAMRAARKHGALVSMDLASFEVVKSCQKTLKALLAEGLVDIVFCNEEEAEALCEIEGLKVEGDQQAIVKAAQASLLQFCKVAVVSLGADGCLVQGRDGAKGAAKAKHVRVVDTIGAGDNFTGAFLYAYLGGASLQTSAQCGCLVGTAAVQTIGAELGAELWQSLKASVDEMVLKDRVAS